MKSLFLRVFGYGLIAALVMVGLFWALAPQFRSQLTAGVKTVTVGESSGAGEPARSGRALNIVTVLPKDAIPAILSPQFVPADQGDVLLEKNEQVLGVFINGDAKAYSTVQLSRHEVVNDVVGGVPVAVTW